jgi:hypothetical protein
MPRIRVNSVLASPNNAQTTVHAEEQEAKATMAYFSNRSRKRAAFAAPVSSKKNYFDVLSSAPLSIFTLMT